MFCFELIRISVDGSDAWVACMVALGCFLGGYVFAYVLNEVL